MDKHSPAGGLVKAAEEMEQRAFAASGWPAESHSLSGKYLEIDSIQDRNRAFFVAHPDIFGAENRCRAFGCGSSLLVECGVATQSEAPPLRAPAWHRTQDKALRPRR